MLPVIFTIAGHQVKAYGFFMMLAHLTGLLVIFLLARRRGLAFAPLIDLFFACMLSGLLGARALYVATHPGESFFTPEKGGFSLFGGFVPAFFTAIALLRWKKLPVLRYADALAPALPFSVALIRLGCFFQGCCYGAPFDGAWGITFTRLDGVVPPALLGKPLHPTQLYEFFFLLALALITLWAGGKAKVHGILATFTVLAYCVFRFVVDFHRGDLERGYLASSLGIEWLTLSQIGALLGILSAPLVLWICLKNREA